MGTIADNPRQLWQPAALEQIRTILTDDPSVLGVVLLGSYSGYAVPDYWSDLDIVVVVRDGDYARFFPATEWLKPFGALYATETTDFEDFAVRRCQFTSLWRIDFDLVSEGSLRGIADWKERLLTRDRRVLFCRSDVLSEALGVTQDLSAGAAPPVADDWWEHFTTEFWFRGMLAATKLGREEMLVGLHLTLDMVRDCAHVAMLLRDRDTGSNHHRDGRDGNHYMPLLERCQHPYTVEGLLDTMAAAATVFDDLASRLDPGYRPRRQTLLEYLDIVRRSRQAPPEDATA